MSDFVYAIPFSWARATIERNLKYTKDGSSSKFVHELLVEVAEDEKKS